MRQTGQGYLAALPAANKRFEFRQARQQTLLARSITAAE
jgi:hypothetical protein